MLRSALSNMGSYGSKTLKPTQLFGTMLGPKNCIRWSPFLLSIPMSWALPSGSTSQTWRRRPRKSCGPGWQRGRKRPKTPWCAKGLAKMAKFKCHGLGMPCKCCTNIGDVVKKYMHATSRKDHLPNFGTCDVQQIYIIFDICQVLGWLSHWVMADKSTNCPDPKNRTITEVGWSSNASISDRSLVWAQVWCTWVEKIPSLSPEVWQSHCPVARLPSQIIGVVLRFKKNTWNNIIWISICWILGLPIEIVL